MKLFYEIIQKILPPNHNYLLFYLLNLKDMNSIDEKYEIFGKILFNTYICKNTFEDSLNIINKTQKIYSAFSRFAYLYKHKKAEIKINTDLFMNEISETDKRAVLIYQEESKSKYLFMITDLINIIKTSITNSQRFFSLPLHPKNPYNNIPFNKSILYNVYFKICETNIIIPSLIREYFNCNFNLNLFKLENESKLREAHIMTYLNDTNNTCILYREIKDMYSSYHKKFNIHTSFPMDTLISIMKPYLYLHCITKYNLHGSEIVHKSQLLLVKKLDEFIKYNPKFGRKIISLNPKKSAIRNICFNTNHPIFTISDIKKNEYTYKGSFSTSSSYSYSDSGSENYEDEDDEDDDEYISDNPEDDDDESTTYEQPSQEININNEENQSTNNYLHTSVIIAYNRLIELGEIIEESNMEEEVPIEEPSAVAEEGPIEENKSNEDELVIIIRSNDSITSNSNKNDDSDSDMSEIENENMENNILDIENISIASSNSTNSSNSH